MNKSVPFTVKTKQAGLKYGGYEGYRGYYPHYETSYFPGYHKTPSNKPTPVASNSGASNKESWDTKKAIVAKCLRVPKTYQSEIRKVLMAGSFTSGVRHHCSHSLIFSIGRLLYAHAHNSTGEKDWEVVQNALNHQPRAVFEAIEIDLDYIFRKHELMTFRIKGEIQESSGELSEFVMEAMAIKKTHAS